jgi:hypothetical protein
MTSVLDGIREEDRPRLERLLRKGWSVPGEHPLRWLDGQRIGGYSLLALVGPKNLVGSRYFHLFLADERGRLAGQPLALGLFNSGPFPAYNWLELIRYESILTLDGQTLDLAAEGLDLPLFQMLSKLAPAGGHLMVEYDSPGQHATERVLTLGHPPGTSPLGYLMFRAGCRSYRDWYISEGGREGPRKLQGFKPLNPEHARERSGQLREELTRFLAEGSGGRMDKWRELARGNAARVLAELEEAPAGER